MQNGNGLERTTQLNKKIRKNILNQPRTFNNNVKLFRSIRSSLSSFPSYTKYHNGVWSYINLLHFHCYLQHTFKHARVYKNATLWMRYKYCINVVLTIQISKSMQESTWSFWSLLKSKWQNALPYSNNQMTKHLECPAKRDFNNLTNANLPCILTCFHLLLKSHNTKYM